MGEVKVTFAIYDAYKLLHELFDRQNINCSRLPIALQVLKACKL